MKRSKKHKKHEKPGPSRPPRNPEKQLDLNYYVKDRVELLQQTFSILKPREIKDMMPNCLKHLPLNELKELCLSELLGISSKRLYATLAGAPPPSDTDSSSDSDQPNFDAMSLESISSDDAVLSQQSSSGASKKKCKGQESPKGKKGKGKGKEKKKVRDKCTDHSSKAAERAGLTVLEMLELQARAQAIKSQLRAEQMKMSQPTSTITSAEAMVSDADDDVEIKEEPPEIVELLSSEDEKPDVKQLQHLITDQLTQEAHTSKPDEAGQSITIRNNLTIIVPMPKVTKKIKLNRQKSTPVVNQTEKTDNLPEITATGSANVTNNIQPDNENKDTATKPTEPEPKTTESLEKKKPKKKKNKSKKKKMADRRDSNAEVSDHDEISLQLSDSEKMDLLEDFDRNSSDGKSSEDSTDSDNSKQSEPEMSSTIDPETKDQSRMTEDTSIKDNADNEVTTTVCDEDIPTSETELDSDNKGRVIDMETSDDTSTLRDVGGDAANQPQCPPGVDIDMDSHNADAQVKSSDKIETKNSEDDASDNDIKSTGEKESHKKKKSKKKKAKKSKKS